VFTLHQLEAETDDDAAGAELPGRPGPDDPFVTVYTSGTTSRPKGCVHTFNTYCAGARALVGPFGYTDTDVQFGPSPIAHTTGLVTSVLLPMLTGAATHVMAKWDPIRGIEEIQRFGCTAAVTAPTFLHTLLSDYDAERHDLSTLRLWTCAGAPIPAAVIERASAALPNIRVLSLYGRSENLVTTTCSVTDEVSRALTSDGKAMPGAEVTIVDVDGNEVPRGTEGDIAYRGPAHMIEYLANPQETAALFTKDGFSKSGDLGTMTEDGYVRVTGRTKDIVIRGGMNISVREIEEHLAHHPALRAFSVVGMPDERLGERVCCYVVAASGHDAPAVDDLREFLIERGVPIQKTPERVVVVDALPMTATGKVLKHELRKDIVQRLEQEAAHAKEVASAT
jgi:acyl-coenzyme A synthetase/AMP-(fatty) acid ligase